jgi:hypothetical protein
MNPLNKLGMWLEALVIAIIARVRDTIKSVVDAIKRYVVLQIKAWKTVAYKLGWAPAFIVGGYAFVPLPGMFLPVRMSETPTLRSGIRDYVYLIIGLFIGTLVGGILYFILGQMNSSGVQIPYSVNVLQYVFNFNSIIGLLFAMVIVIIAVVLIIRYLRGTQEGWE